VEYYINKCTNIYKYVENGGSICTDKNLRFIMSASVGNRSRGIKNYIGKIVERR